MLRGELFAAECLTEPTGGSDFFGSKSRAEDKGDYFLLNGQKRFIVGGEGADFFLVYAVTEPEVKPQEGITAFIVERGPGVETKYLYGLMGCRGGGTARLVFRDVKVPRENVIGKVNGAYEVFNTMMIPERLGTAAMTIGAAKPALDIATGYTSRRSFRSGDQPVPGVSFQVAEAAMLLDAARSLVYTTARAVDENQITAGSDDGFRDKEVCHRILPESGPQCYAVVGGIGYTIFCLERIYRDIRLASIWTGSNEVMSMIIAHGGPGNQRNRAARQPRDFAADAEEAFAEDELIYE